MPTEITYPGVYIEELPAGVRSISGVPTSIAAFLGHAASGPVNLPVHAFSVAEFEASFGPCEDDCELGQAVRLFFANGGSAAFIVRVEAEGQSPIPAEIEGSRAKGTGLFALDKADQFNLLLAPGQSNPAVHAALARYARERRAFAILDLPSSVGTPAEVEEWLRNNALPRHANSAVYFPPLKVRRLDGSSSACANSGAIAGVYARTDIAQGVWKPPAGTDVFLRGTRGLSYVANRNEAASLTALGINALRTFNRGPIVGGARTLMGADGQNSDWKYVPVRRLALYIEESLHRGLQWVVFEPNDEPLWARIRLSVGAFMIGLFKAGALQGPTPAEAYFVKCDRATNSQSDINLGIVNVVVGFAPLKPAEFVVLTLRQIAGQSDP